MNKKILLLVAALIVAAVPAVAGDKKEGAKHGGAKAESATAESVKAEDAKAEDAKPAGEFKATGWVVDAQCGKANANAKGADCVRTCNKNGSPLVLSVGDKIYKLSNQDLAKENIGHPVKVTGTLNGDTVEVASIAKAGKA